MRHCDAGYHSVIRPTASIHFWDDNIMREKYKSAQEILLLNQIAEALGVEPDQLSIRPNGEIAPAKQFIYLEGQFYPHPRNIASGLKSNKIDKLGSSWSEIELAVQHLSNPYTTSRS